MFKFNSFQLHFTEIYFTSKLFHTLKKHNILGHGSARTKHRTAIILLLRWYRYEYVIRSLSCSSWRDCQEDGDILEFHLRYRNIFIFGTCSSELDYVRWIYLANFVHFHMFVCTCIHFTYLNKLQLPLKWLSLTQQTQVRK